MSIQLTQNTGRLIRLIIRREGLSISLWLGALTLTTVLTALSFVGLYPTAQERQALSEAMVNPALTAMVGPGFGLDNYTLGAMMAHQMLLLTALAVAIMNILIVNRNTRGDEEVGRVEMIRALPVGRLANLGAVIGVLLITNLLLATMIAWGLFAVNVEGMDLAGSILYGTILGITGLLFAGITALFAQLSENSRSTLGFSFATLGAFYLIRAIGDVGNEALSWLSPLGLILRSQVFVNNYWWPTLLTLGLALIIIVISFYLNGIRDLGAGFIPAKPGPNKASRFLLSPLGLILRLQRTGIIAWSMGMFILGASYGSVLGDLEAFFEGNEMLQEFLPTMDGFSLTEQYLAMLMSVIAIFCTIPALMVLLKLKGEERMQRTEHLLARAISRTHILGSYLLLSIALGFFTMVLAVLGLWLAGRGVMAEPISFAALFRAAMVYLPAMWMILGLATLLIGFMPKATMVAWLFLGYSFFMIYVGSLLQLPAWLTTLSPFDHIPLVPMEEINYSLLLILTIRSLALMALGFLGYNIRDIQG